MNDGMVQLNKVTKAYGSFQLDCSMEVQTGMATGFVGAAPDPVFASAVRRQKLSAFSREYGRWAAG